MCQGQISSALTSWANGAMNYDADPFIDMQRKLSKIFAIYLPRESILSFLERDLFSQRSTNIRKFYVLAGLNTVYHLMEKLSLRLV